VAQTVQLQPVAPWPRSASTWKRTAGGVLSSAGDALAKLLRLTAKGRSALAATQDAERGWADDLGAQIGERDLHRTGAVLDRILVALGMHGVLPDPRT